MSGYFVRIEAELSKANIEFQANGNDMKLEIFHNMYQHEIDSDFVNWTARAESTEKLTSQNFCNYILSKNSMTGHLAAVTTEELGIMIDNAIDSKLII